MNEEYENINLLLPNGFYLRATAVNDENFPAINIDLVSADEKHAEQVCFVEYNPEREQNREVCIGVYHNGQEDPDYYDSYVSEKHQYSYSVDNNNVMTVLEDNCTLCTVSDVFNEEQAQNLLKELVFELRGVVLNESEKQHD